MLKWDFWTDFFFKINLNKIKRKYITVLTCWTKKKQENNKNQIKFSIQCDLINSGFKFYF